jgi:hypothetical protein
MALSELTVTATVVGKAIEFMADHDVSDDAVASALLGGSLSIMARSRRDDAIVQVLTDAIASVQAGNLRG